MKAIYREGEGEEEEEEERLHLPRNISHLNKYPNREENPCNGRGRSESQKDNQGYSCLKSACTP